MKKSKTNYQRNKKAILNYQEKLNSIRKRFEIPLLIEVYNTFKSICELQGVKPISKARELITNYILQNEYLLNKNKS